VLIICRVVGACIPVLNNPIGLDSLVLLSEDDYCFVDECTIRINDSNALLNIINNTGDWITATNTTNLFTASSNGTNCTSNQELDSTNTIYFTTIIAIHCITIFPSLANIILHLVVKELRTVSGKLVIALCVTITVISLITIVQGVFQLLHLANLENCNVFKYSTAMMATVYESIKVNILFHFAYLMYQSYKMSTNAKKDKTFLISYFTCDAGVTLLYSVILIAIDQTSDTGAFFVTSDGLCEFDNHLDSILSYYLIITLVVLVLAETVLFFIGIVLYYLVSKSFCVAKGQGNIRVIFTLFTTVGLNAIIYVCLKTLNQVQYSYGVAKLGASVATCVEQFTLLIIFLTSNKVKTAIVDKMEKV